MKLFNKKNITIRLFVVIFFLTLESSAIAIPHLLKVLASIECLKESAVHFWKHYHMSSDLLLNSGSPIDNHIKLKQIGIDIDKPINSLWDTALIVEARNGNTQNVKTLLALGANTNKQNHLGNTALIEAKTSEIEKLLIDGGANLQEALITAVLNDDINKVKALISYGAQVNSEKHFGPTVLHKASSCQMVTLLVQAGANIDASSYCGTPLIQSLIEKNLDKACTLIKLGACVDYDSSTGSRSSALEIAIVYDLPEVVSLLLDKGADVDKIYWKREGLEITHYTPLFVAICNNPKLVPLILSKKPNINFKDGSGDMILDIKDGSGNTALHIAARYHDAELMDLLIKQGIDSTIKNSEGKTAMDIFDEHERS